MPSVDNVLVVGGGTAGTATAILLAEGGVSVDLIESTTDLDRRGSGISLQGNALRVLRSLGVWAEVKAAGCAFNAFGMRAPDEHATVLAVIDDARTGGPDLPATVGIRRSALAALLLRRAAEVGVKIRTGTTFTTLAQFPDGVEAHLTDGSVEPYDLVVGADGIHSATREAIGIDLTTHSTGMGAWRAIVPRPPSIDHIDVIYGGPAYTAGYCPINDKEMYLFLLEDLRDPTGLTPQQRLDVVRGLAEHYHGPWDDIRGGLTDPDLLHYARFEWHLLDQPWHRGRVVLVGDAVHVCPPTLAQGAAVALEDAAVLAELLLASTDLDDTLLTAYAARRAPRAGAVVDGSRQIVEWLLADVHRDIPVLMDRITTLLTEPA